jgi:hypothetical protein
MTNIPDDYPVVPLALNEIEEIMDRLRAAAGLLPHDRIVPDEFMSAVGFKFHVQQTTKMQGAETFALAAENTIWSTWDFSKRLRLGDRECLYTWGHEVGHLALHRGPGPKARLAGKGNKKLAFIPERESAEGQAWLASRALFLPRAILIQDADLIAVGNKTGVPIRAVRERLDDVEAFKSLSRPKTTPADVAQYLAKAGRKTSASAGYADQQRLAAWLRLGTIDGENADEFRLARGFKVRWSDYGLLASQSDYAWVIWGGEARCCRDVFSR